MRVALRLFIPFPTKPHTTCLEKGCLETKVSIFGRIGGSLPTIHDNGYLRFIGNGGLVLFPSTHAII